MNEVTILELNNILCYIGEKIFNNLSTRDLKNCRYVCRTWRATIDGKKYFWLRMIKVHNEKINLWKEEVLAIEASVAKLRTLALAQKRYLMEVSAV